MRSVFTSGHYTYTRHYADSDIFSEYYSWAKNATKTFALPAPYTGTEYIEGESQIIVEAWIGEGEPDQAIYYYGNENRILIGQGMFIPGATPVGENFTFSYDPSNNRVSVTAKYAISQVCGVYISVKGFSTSEVSVKVADDYKLNAVLDDIPSTVSDGTNTYSVVGAAGCFENCINLVQAPSIPSSVNDMGRCFYGCRSLGGNIEVYDVEGRYDVFTGTDRNIFVINKSSTIISRQRWVITASKYSNVFYEANSSLKPSITNFNAIRVASSGSATPATTGLYAYVTATLAAYETNIPVGWTNEIKSKTLTDNGSTESPTWYSSTGTDPYTADVWCWISLGDTATHELTLQVADSIKDNGTEKESKNSLVSYATVLKSYALVNCYHDENASGVTEGMAIGKYAEYADLFDIDMPTRHRQAVQYDDDVSVGGKLTVTEQTSTENLLLQLDTSGASGTVDDDIYADLVTLGWDTDVIV